MAERKDVTNVTALPKNADQILFVEDLISYMELQYPSNHVLKWDLMQFRTFIYNAFDPIVENAIYFLDNKLKIVHYNLICHLRDINAINSCNFVELAKRFAQDHFHYGFKAEKFLFYCVTMCRLAKYFYSLGLLDATVLAKKYILQVIQRYNMLKGGWKAVHKIAEILIILMQDSNVPIPQSPDSDEIGPQDRTENKVSGDESNTSPSEDQNVLSENEDWNHEAQHERACSRKEPFLKESAESSSESSCDRDLSPLKEPNSLSEGSSSTINFEGNKRINRSRSKDKLRTGILNNGKGSFLIKGNYKFTPFLKHSSKCSFESSNELGVRSSKRSRSSSIIKSDCERRLNLPGNDIMRGKSQLCSEENKLIHKTAPDDRVCPGPSNAYEKSNSTKKKYCKRKRDPSSDEKNDNYPSMHSDGNNSISKFESNENFGSQMPNVDEKSDSSKIKLDFQSSEGKNECTENVWLTDEEESPSKLEGLIFRMRKKDGIWVEDTSN